MTLELWTVVAAVLLPYVPYLLTAWEKRRRGIYDAANPRESNRLLEGWAQRAKGAEANSFEALTAYVAVAWVAHTAGADPETLGVLGVAWVVVRLAYIASYVAGYGALRGATWGLGVVILIARCVLAARA